MYASVTIDHVADRLFDYLIPDGLDVVSGLQVTVPFGARLVHGYVVSVSAQPNYTPPVRPVKPVVENEEEDLFGVVFIPQERVRTQSFKEIVAIDDPVPFFTPAVITLLHWIAEYYCSSFTQAVRCALPAPVRAGRSKVKEVYFVEPVNPLPEALSATLRGRRKALYEDIFRLSGGRLQSLCDELKTTTATLQKLATLGYVTIEKTTVRRDPMKGRRLIPTLPRVLMAEQAEALVMINASTLPVLLFGVTGSGKTEVYMQAMGEVIARGQGAIMLVPEIALTPQTVQRFSARFGDLVAVLHSGLSDGERHDEWHRIRRSEARIVVGPRSAVFAPIANLGLIVVDEEHEPSYKQDEAPRYSARDAAIMRAHIERCQCILGSATPSFESWHNAQCGKYTLVRMAHRVEHRPLPDVYLVDMCEGSQRDGKASIFSQELIEAMKLRRHKGEQTILFLNRRGYSPTVICTKCGYVAVCPQCSVKLNYHQREDVLRCHMCGYWTRPPSTCPECKDPDFRYQGFGTQRVEQALLRIMPDVRVIRMDADTTSRRFSHDELLAAFRSGEADILLGTQMIAKGLDFPNVTLVGILAADMSLHIPDFRAPERTFQLLAQVSGRAGRGEIPGDVYIQTYTPDHPAIQASRHADFEDFARQDLADREAAGYPPYTRLSCLTFRSPNLDKVQAVCENFAAALKQIDPELDILPALPSPLEKHKLDYRWQIIIRHPSAKKIVRAVRHVATHVCDPEVRLAIDIDALSLN